MPVFGRSSSRWQALACTLVFVACALICRPWAEIGIYDDWSYVRTAELLAQTGHIHYNGWATAMLGWQLYPAAAFIRWFGMSFTVVRLTTFIVAAVTVFLLHRCAVRLGLTPRNAAFATLVVASSPILLPLATTYMSDVFGLAAMVACLYCALRALRSTEVYTIPWLVTGTLTGVAGGTARQTAWLGALVVMPVAAWLLRKRRAVVVAEAILLALSLVSILATLHWYGRQAYAVPETFEALRPAWGAVIAVVTGLLRLAMETGLFLLPVLILFVPQLRSGRSLVVTVSAMACLGVLVAFRGRVHLGKFLVPTLLDGGNYVSLQGMLTTWPEHGARPVVLSEAWRLFLTVAVLAGFLGSAASVRGSRASAGSDLGVDAVDPQQGSALLLTMFIGYVGLLLPRAAAVHLYDRYGLPLLVLGSLLLVRVYQKWVRSDVPLWAMLPVIVVGAYSVATTHDMFAMFRATATATAELVSAGVPREQIDGGWEYEAWTQLLSSGYVHELRLKLPGDDPHPGRDSRSCPMDAWWLFPDVKPVYALAFQPDMCDGPAPFSPVSFRTWLPWRTQTIYVVESRPK